MKICTFYCCLHALWLFYVFLVTDFVQHPAWHSNEVINARYLYILFLSNQGGREGNQVTGSQY